MSSFNEQITGFIKKGKTFEELGKMERIALTAHWILGLDKHQQHEFITDCEGSNELIEALIRYLCAWNLPETFKEQRQQVFERKLEQIVFDYCSNDIQAEYAQQEKINHESEKQQWA